MRISTLFASIVTVSALMGTAAYACDSCGCTAKKKETATVKAGSACQASCPATSQSIAKAVTSHGHAHDIVDTAVAAGKFNTLVAAVKAAGLVETLKGEGPYTVFAPTDEAFAKLPKGTVEELVKPENRALLTAILTYHVVPGNMTAEQVIGKRNLATANGQQIDLNYCDKSKGLYVDKARVVKADIACGNGVIHVIDTVIMPSTADIVATAVEAGSFNTLAAALKAAGLVEALQGNGPFTVFAPTDQAFAKLPKGTVENLLKEENRDQLAAILKHHVVSGRIFAGQVTDGATVKTLNGTPLIASVSKGQVMIGGSKVVSADIDATNGVIHVIDSVLLPPATTQANAAD
jgi:uncharacterized surface protein with fasciclin (FAS1) repeats